MRTGPLLPVSQRKLRRKAGGILVRLIIVGAILMSVGYGIFAFTYLGPSVKPGREAAVISSTFSENAKANAAELGEAPEANPSKHLSQTREAGKALEQQQQQRRRVGSIDADGGDFGDLASAIGELDGDGGGDGEDAGSVSVEEAAGGGGSGGGKGDEDDILERQRVRDELHQDRQKLHRERQQQRLGSHTLGEGSAQAPKDEEVETLHHLKRAQADAVPSGTDAGDSLHGTFHRVLSEDDGGGKAASHSPRLAHGRAKHAEQEHGAGRKSVAPTITGRQHTVNSEGLRPLPDADAPDLTTHADIVATEVELREAKEPGARGSGEEGEGEEDGAAAPRPVVATRSQRRAKVPLKHTEPESTHPTKRQVVQPHVVPAKGSEPGQQEVEESKRAVSEPSIRNGGKHLEPEADDGTPAVQPSTISKAKATEVEPSVQTHEAQSEEVHAPHVSAGGGGSGGKQAGKSHGGSGAVPAEGLYTYSAIDIDGEEVSLSKYAGKVTLVVNVASHCGYTDANYKGLMETYDKYHRFGFEILAFPCNQFGQQESGSEQEIKSFCTSKYHVAFPMFAKVDVNGPNAHPIFKFLKKALPESEGGGGEGRDLTWNFNKFIVNQHGQPVKFFFQDYDIGAVEAEVYRLLHAGRSHGKARAAGGGAAST